MKKYALVMIDMQRGFIDPSSPLCIPAAAATVPACAEVIRLCHEKNVPVFYTRATTEPTAATLKNAAAMCGSRAASRCLRSVMSACRTRIQRSLR